MHNPRAAEESVLVPTRFVWPYGGGQVHVCGSFTNWLETVPMAPDGSSRGQVFAVVCNLPPGYHQYKFVVDGEWRHDEAQALMPDPLGNVNNWLFVKKPDVPGSPTATSPAVAGAARAAAPIGGGMDWQMADVHAMQQVASWPGPVGVVGAVGGPLAVAAGEADASRARISEFLQRHTAYELLPESSKVVVLDTTLPVRQAFHVMYEQGIYSAPLWDEKESAFVGMMSAGDFIDLLRQLHSSGATTLENIEFDALTISAYRNQLELSGRAPRALVAVGPEDSLHAVVSTVLQSGCATVPILVYGAALTSEPGAGTGGGAPPTSVPQLLHLATLSSVLACLARHFRGVPAALPLLSQPLGALPLGTWTEQHGGMRGRGGAQPMPNDIDRNVGSAKLRPLRSVHPSTTLADALSEMLSAGISAVPVVDEAGTLLDIYARSDITSLAHDSAYASIKPAEISVQQALSIATEAASRNGTAGLVQHRMHICARTDTLRTAVETLSLPGVRRLVCVEPGTNRIEGVLSLADVAMFLCS